MKMLQIGHLLLSSHSREPLQCRALVSLVDTGLVLPLPLTRAWEGV